MLDQLRRTMTLFFGTTVLVGGVGLATAGSAAAAEPVHSDVVSTVPSPSTPAIENGSVQGIAQVGSTMVLSGDFTSATSPGGATVSRNGVLAFNASTGAISAGFNPAVNGSIEAVLAGPTPGTVYIAGGFTQVNNTQARRIALLNVSNGSLVSSFSAPAVNGPINTIERYGSRLYAGGNFTNVGGTQHGGLAAFNATSGAVDPFVGQIVDQHHNNSGSGAQGAIGVKDLEVTPDGSKLVAIGNFKVVDGLPRDQLVVLDLTGTSAAVQGDWRTKRYEPLCYNWAFDSYMRGLSVSPDGSYFVISSTGGGNQGTLCDSVSRFEFSATGQEIQPTWSDFAGGDTLWGIEATESAVYVGGHGRWMNNSFGRDFAAQGAVPRPGLAALDPRNGVPLAWNPGRNPRGVAVYEILATPDGLWVGSNTEWVGNRKYRRERIAFFPLAGGAPRASDALPGLPGTAYLAGSTAQTQGNILYRVNAGGDVVNAADNGPDWSADQGGTSPYRNGGSNAASYSPSVTLDGSVPSSTPLAVFDSERWSPSDNPAMEWAFPAPAGTPLQVRLYFANRYTGTGSPGQRVFDVTLDGSKVLDNFDIVAAATADQRGVMRSFDVVSDGEVDIDFSHEIENPLIDAIEIVRTDQAPPTAPAALQATTLTQSGASQPAAPIADQGVEWASMRGAFVAGGKLWYGRADATFHSRTISGGTFGPEVSIDPYRDPAWAGVSTGSGSSTYDGVVVDLYGQMSSVTSMAYANGRLYYTRSGNPNLYWRWFSTDSGIIGPDTFTANGGRNWSGTAGMFASGDQLYFVSNDGNLNRIELSGGAPSGSSAVVDGPSDSGTNWRARAVFLGPPTSNTPVNEAPSAAFTSSCVELTCSFDGSSSSDPDGSVASWAWDFGTGSGSGVQVAHTFASEGTYTVSLTVNDGQGGTNSTSQQVTVEVSPPANQSPKARFNFSCVDLTCTFDASGSTDPDGSVTTWEWSFGPGTASGEQVSHTFPGPGEYMMSLTVTDDQGATDSLGDTLAFSDNPPDNQAPSAAFTSSCIELTCSFDGSTSTDPDGSVSSWFWDFESGTDTGEQVSYTFSTAGTYTVSLTVGDGQGGTNSTSQQVIVEKGTEPATDVEFVASTGANANSKKPKIEVPTGVLPGDTLLLTASIGGSPTVADPVGWTPVDVESITKLDSRVWTRTATASDAGSAVTVALSKLQKSSMAISAYRGVGSVASAATTVDGATSTHTAPSVTVPSGSWVVWFWSERGNNTASWTPGAGVTLRQDVYSTGGGRVSALVGDTGTARTGVVAGPSATTDVKSSGGVNWSIVLVPATD